MTAAAEADYIVVGAGSAGCVVANRLSADPDIAVLLIEAGDSGESDPAVLTPGRWAALLGSLYDWQYATEPEGELGSRRLPFPRGKGFGGSSAINAMVHIRGHRACFDAWHAAGNDGWGYGDLLPFFKRSERNDQGPTEHRGASGPLAVSRCADSHEGHHAFLAAAVEQGCRADAAFDFNVPDPDGVAGFYQRNLWMGRRHSAAAAFLLPAMSRSNLHVVPRAQATRVLVEGRRAAGVEYIRDGRAMQARAGREVVLCAGAVDSPRLLLLSGIGPADDLRAHGIGVVADVPGVGRNLQDHLKLSARWKAKRPLPGSSVTAGLFMSSSGNGPADLQFYVGRGLEQPDEHVTITVSLVRPQSRGSVTLRSRDPLAMPVVRGNYLRAGRDLAALVEGLARARAIGYSRAYDSLRGDEVEPGATVTATADVERFVREKADTIYHAAGTCRMGPASDGAGVVDARLRVRGVEGLRVADASIMPDVVNAPTHAACVAIGERLSSLLEEERRSVRGTINGREARDACRG